MLDTLSAFDAKHETILSLKTVNGHFEWSINRETGEETAWCSSVEAPSMETIKLGTYIIQSIQDKRSWGKREREEEEEEKKREGKERNDEKKIKEGNCRNFA